MQKRPSKKQRRKNTKNRAPKRVLRSGNSTTVTVRKSMPAAVSQQITNRGALRQITLKHKEFVTDVEYQSNWDTTRIIQYDVNPGLALRFPWLSGIARQFESYVFTKLAYIYVPAVGTTEKGSIAIIPDYDPADDNSTLTKSQLFSFQDSKRGPLWSTLRMECGAGNLRKQKTYYVRDSPLAGSLDIKTYDPLSLTLMLNHEAEQINLGELWVEYTIVLKTPQLQEEVNVDTLTSNGWDPNTSDPYAGAVEIVGTYPIASNGSDALKFKKSGYYMYQLVQDLDTYDASSPSVGFLEWAVDVGAKLLSASFDEVGYRSFTSMETGLVHLPNYIEDFINGTSAVNPGFSNVTTSGDALGEFILTPISKNMYTQVILESNLDISKKYVPGMSYVATRKSKKRNSRKSKLRKSVEELTKTATVNLSTKNVSDIPKGRPELYVTT